MPAITERKADLKAIIIKTIEKYLDEHPEATRRVAIGACRKLAGRMTLKELQNWNMVLLCQDRSQ